MRIQTIWKALLFTEETALEKCRISGSCVELEQEGDLLGRHKTNVGEMFAVSLFRLEFRLTVLADPVSLLAHFIHVRQPLLARAVSAQGCLAAFEKAYVRGEILQKMMPVRTQYQRCIGSSSTPTYRQDSCSRMNCGSKSPQYGQVKPPDSDEETGGSGNSSSCMPSKDSALLEGAILPCCSLGLNEVLTVYPVERGPIEIGPPTRAVPLTA
jgi:hypothetical protein